MVDAQDVMSALRKMAEVVDRQNAADPTYRPMAPDFSGIAFLAASDLTYSKARNLLDIRNPFLHQRRLELKARA